MASTILLFALQRERKRTLHRERISYVFSSGFGKGESNSRDSVVSGNGENESRAPTDV